MSTELLAINISIILIILYIPIALWVYIKYLSDKQRFSRFDRNMFVSFGIVFIPSIIFLIVGTFTGLISWKTLYLGFLGLFVFTFICIFGQQFSEFILGERIERKRKELDKLPDGPKKQKLEREQELLEKIWKNR